jgi:hypothetical protein
MPLPKIHVVEGRCDKARIAKVSGAMQATLMNALRVPPEDFYQLIFALPKKPVFGLAIVGSAGTASVAAAPETSPMIEINKQADKSLRIPARTRILSAAAELFSRHGFGAVSIEAIARTAGTNKMTLYHHFASKDGLVAGFRPRRAAELRAVLRALRASEQALPDHDGVTGRVLASGAKR